MLIYFMIAPIVLLCSIQAEKYNRFGWLVLLVLLLSFVSGLRAESVGIDTQNYIDKFLLIYQGKPQLAYGLEPGFKLWVGYFLKINGNPTFLFVIIALVTNFLILRRLWDFRYIASVPCMILCYYAAFYGYTFNIMRQFLALSIIFFSSRLLEKRKYMKFAVIVLICAFFIHQSSVICLGFIGTDLFIWKNLSKAQRFLLGSALLMIPIGFWYIMDHMFVKYSGYFEISSENLGFMILAKFSFFIFSLYVTWKTLIPGKTFEIQKSNYQEYRMRKAVVIYYPIGMLLTAIGYFYPFMDRIGLYYMIFECVYFGMLVKTNFSKSLTIDNAFNNKIIEDNALIFAFIILALTGYNFITDLFNNAQGIVPYSFINF